MEGSGSEQIKCDPDPDPGDPKTSGFETLVSGNVYLCFWILIELGNYDTNFGWSASWTK